MLAFFTHLICVPFFIIRHDCFSCCTEGWSITTCILDFLGSSFSILQLMLDSHDKKDMEGISGNVVKLALGVISIAFDAIFFFQHYVLYSSSRKAEYAPLLEDDDVENANNGIPRDVYVNEAGQLIHSGSGRQVVVVDESVYSPHPEMSVSGLNDTQEVTFGAQCFWGTQQLFSEIFSKKRLPHCGMRNGIVGYMGNPEKSDNVPFSIEDITSGKFGHIEVFTCTVTGGGATYAEMVKFFFQIHDSTLQQQPQYTSSIYCYSEAQYDIASRLKAQMQHMLDRGEVTCLQGRTVLTQIVDASNFLFTPAEDKQQNYLHKHPKTKCTHKLLFEQWLSNTLEDAASTYPSY